MLLEPLPDPGSGDEEPEGFVALPGSDSGNGGAEQGLFITLPAEELTLAGFGQNGASDTMAPGPLLASVLHAITGEDGSGLAGLADDQLVGVLSGAQRLEARACWTRLAALAEFARRRPPSGEPVDTGLAGFSDFAADELTGALRATSMAIAEQLGYACAVTARLPKTFAALAAGLIHPVHVKIIEDETRILSPEDAAEADEKLAEAAKSKTFAQLRYAAHQLVLELDPDAALRRKEKARQDAHVRRFREDSGNAGMVAREMPPDEVLASWQHVVQRALDLRAAGVPGALQELRVRAYLDLLQETDTRATLASQHPSGPDPGPDPGPDAGPANPGPANPGPANPGPGGNGGPGPRDGGPAAGGPGGPGGRVRRAREDKGPSIAALVNITIPWTALQGDTGPPGEAAGFGLLDHQATRDLAAAAARHPDTRWCLTVLDPGGTAAAHACAPGRYRAPPAPAALTATLAPITRGHCDHRHAEPGYRPSRKLEHLINARSTRCTAPGCGRPAARCDKDHTIPWDQGGLTCECDLAPLCRHHHRCKQAEGWRLEQPEPGVLIWHTPSGRTYTTTPSVYPV